MIPMILTDQAEIREAVALGFTGNVYLATGRAVAGNVSPCDVVGAERTGIFTDLTVSSRTSGAFRRMPVRHVVMVEIWDI